MWRIILIFPVSIVLISGGALGAYQAGVKGEWWDCFGYIGFALLFLGGAVVILRRELWLRRALRRADKLLSAASGGDAVAQCHLADFYDEIGMEAEAFRFYVAAARGGVPEAMYRVGCLLMPGVGAPCREDEEEGIEWLSRAYEAGDARGAGWLAALYEHGSDFTPANADLARLWRERETEAAHANESERK